MASPNEPDMSQEIELISLLRVTAECLEKWRQEKKPKERDRVDINALARHCALDMDILVTVLRLECQETVIAAVESGMAEKGGE